MFSEVVGRNAVEDSRLGSRLGRPVGGPNAVLVQPRDTTVPNPHDPVPIGSDRCLDVDMREAVTGQRRHHRPGEAPLDVRRVQKGLHQLLVEVVSQQAQGDEIPLGYDRSEHQPRDVEEEYVHRRTKPLTDGVWPEAELADERPLYSRRLELR